MDLALWSLLVDQSAETPAAVQQKLYNDLIAGLKADGVWPLLDRIFVLADGEYPERIDQPEGPNKYGSHGSQSHPLQRIVVTQATARRPMSIRTLIPLSGPTIILGIAPVSSPGATRLASRMAGWLDIWFWNAGSWHSVEYAIFQQQLPLGY